MRRNILIASALILATQAPAMADGMPINIPNPPPSGPVPTQSFTGCIQQVGSIWDAAVREANKLPKARKVAAKKKAAAVWQQQIDQCRTLHGVN